MRIQVRSIATLAQVAEDFGKEINTPFKPYGSSEVRKAGIAFIKMKERIQKQISERTQMLAGVSHDLRTPLTRMKLQLAMLPESPYKTECIKGNNCKTPMEKRNKVLMVSKTMSQKRAEDLERITSEYGTMLRMNRSIQAEGSFADVKEDMNFRRYLYRGKANALAESILLAMGRNINKLHCKIQTGRTGSYLFPLKRA